MLVFEVTDNCVYPQIAAEEVWEKHVLTTVMDRTECALITEMCLLGENLLFYLDVSFFFH